MYRLLIIDDEPHIIHRIRHSIDWEEQFNIQIIGEATNGLTGLSIAMEHQPDIVICDIRMPLMDGISFATEYQRHFPNSQIIFLSGYSDKMYMQTAIRLKVVDYIFKPYDLSDLVSAIEKAILQLTNHNPHQDKYTNDNLLPELLYWADSATDLQQFLADHALSVSFSEPYICMLVRFNSGISFSQYIQGTLSDTVETQRLLNSYYKDFESKLRSLFHGKVLMSILGNNYVIFANTPNPDQIPDLAELLQFTPYASVAIGVSSIYQTPEVLKLSFQTARNNVLSCFLLGFNQVFTSYSSRHFSTEHEARTRFSTSFENRNLSEASNALNDYFTYISNCSPEYISSIQEDLLQIALLINGHLQSSPFKLISEFIHLAATVKDIQQYIQHLISRYVSELDSLDNYGKIIYDTEQFILQNLEAPLSVKQIADSVFVSHTYLCFLYKKKTGRTLKQFILDARMQKAKRLLLDTNLKIGDIASSLGYPNQNYFTKTFSSYYGKTPSTFRKQEP